MQEHPDKEHFFDSDSAKSDNEVVSRLEARLNDAEISKKRERFFWVIVIGVAIDALIFMHMNTWSAPIVIGVIQIIAIVPLGEALEVKFFRYLCDRILDKWNGNVGSKK